MAPKEHAKSLGLLFLIYAGFQLLMTIVSGVMVFAMMGGIMSEISKMPRKANEPDPAVIMSFLPVIMVFALVIGLLFLIPKVIAGLGLRGEKRWARVWAIVGSCLSLLDFPLGTALGIYGLWFLFGEQGKAYFGGYDTAGGKPPPPPHSWQ